MERLQPLLALFTTEIPVWAAFAVVLLTVAVGQNTRAASFLAGLAAPLLNSRKNAVSLGRSSLFLTLWAQGWFILKHPESFVRLGWPPAIVLCLVDLFLLVYCFGDKPWIRDLGQTVASRFAFGTTIQAGAGLKQLAEGDGSFQVADADANGSPTHSQL